jgi:penicillin-binding protein 2
MENLTLRKDKSSKVILYIFFAILFILTLRLYYLQVVKVAYYQKISEKNYIRPLPLIAPRGLICDRNGKVLVSNFPSYTLLIMPSEVENLWNTIDELSSLTGVEGKNLGEKIKGSWPHSYQPIRVKRQVDFSTLCVVEERNEELPGIFYQVELNRKYPVSRWSGHLLGYVSEISLEELKKPEYKGSRLGDLVGKEGIEKEYDDLLKGQKGTRYMEVSATGKILGELEDKKPVMSLPGSNLELTIDLDLQSYAESSFYPYRSGALIVMDPRNGEILTMLSKPGFDSNIFTGTLTPEEWEKLVSDPDLPFLNRTIQGLYPPGSTLKLLTAAAALEEEIINENTTLSPCYGFFPFGDRIFRCWVAEGHGKLNLIDAIAQSCDVYFYQLGLKLGLEKWSWYAERCGLSRELGLDLPGEKAGLVPTLEYYYKKLGKQKWIKNLVINLSIGQGEIMLTPLQVTAFYCGLLNDGWVFQPRILKRIISQGKITSYEPEVLRKLPFSSETLEILKKAMIKTVEDPSGTGHLAWIPGVKVGGKTGTAQNPHGKSHAWFVGFAPAEKPKILVTVLIENAGHGGDVAAPVAREIILKYLQKDFKELVKR